jgi:hypothetical protein
MLFVEILAVLVGTFIAGNFIGYGIHRLLHFRSMGVMYRAHLYHHKSVYPPDDYLSDEYREPMAEQTWYYLIPILLFAACFFAWHWYYVPFVALEGALVLKLNAIVHDNLHIRGHRWERYAWFWRLRGLHYQHHVKEATNLGIFVWFPDKALGTYEGAMPLPDKYLTPSAQHQIATNL